jgi:secreted trypsin-like serine protease
MIILTYNSFLGGPLICELNGKATLVGVTSWGSANCGRAGNPGMYEDVFNEIDWITKVLSERPNSYIENSGKILENISINRLYPFITFWLECVATTPFNV